MAFSFGGATSSTAGSKVFVLKNVIWPYLISYFYYSCTELAALVCDKKLPFIRYCRYCDCPAG